jgi:hypothetical protein
MLGKHPRWDEHAQRRQHRDASEPGSAYHDVRLVVRLEKCQGRTSLDSCSSGELAVPRTASEASSHVTGLVSHYVRRTTIIPGRRASRAIPPNAPVSRDYFVQIKLFLAPCLLRRGDCPALPLAIRSTRRQRARPQERSLPSTGSSLGLRRPCLRPDGPTWFIRGGQR